MRSNPTQIITSSHNWLFIIRRIIQKLCVWVLFFILNMEQFKISFFSRFRLLRSFSSNHLSDFFYFPQKLIKNKSPELSSINWTIFFFKIIQHCKTWNVIVLFPSYKVEETELLFFKSYIIQICVNQVFV